MTRGSLKRVLQQARAPRRAARSRGFGVHSPFAFRFIREVLRQPYAYYAYPEIECLCREDKTDVRVAKALYRLALFFRTEGITLQGEAPEAMVQAIKKGLNHTIAEEVATCITGVGGGIKSVTQDWAEASTGMLFSAPELAVFVRSPHLPHQAFKILLP